MVRSDLKLVTRQTSAHKVWVARWAEVVFGLSIVTFGLLATLLGADVSRQELQPREIAAEGLRLALEHGSAATEVRATTLRLRERLVRSPLDSKTRVAYASLLLGIARTTQDLETAAFHARLAAQLAPVTVPVLRGATLVLIQTGDPLECVFLVRKMFGFDPGAAARLLDQIEPMLPEDQIEQAIPDEPDAWIARGRQLRSDGRSREAEAWLERGLDKWPGHVGLWVRVADRAWRLRDWSRLERLVPVEGDLPNEGAAAVLYAHRAHLKLRTDDRKGAQADLDEALRLDRHGHSVLLRSGEVYQAMGESEQAKQVWTRLFFGLSVDALSSRQFVLRRLARLEEERSQPGSALRHWRALLDITPEDEEARRRVADLTGAIP